MEFEAALRSANAPKKLEVFTRTLQNRINPQ